MKKKIIISTICLIAFAVTGWIYFTAPEQIIVETSNGPEKQMGMTPPSIKIAPEVKEETKTTEENGVKIRVRENNDPEFAEFDKIEQKWLQKAEQTIGGEFYQQYLQMRDENDKEKLKAYEEYHSYLRQKYGDKFSYNLSEDNSKREKDINQKWLKEFHKLIGEEAFKKYLTARDQFNEEQRRKNKDALIIEF